MDFTNQQIADSFPALQALAVKELPIQVSFKIGRNLRKVSEAHKDYEASRATLIDKYAQKGEDGSPLPGDVPNTIKLKDGPAFNKESGELMAVSVSIDVITVTLADFGDVKLAPSIFSALEWMIVPSPTL